MEQQRVLSFGAAGRVIGQGDLVAKFQQLKPHLDRIRGDHDLNEQQPLVETRAAAVLIPIIKHDDDFSILLTKRTDHLKHHPGQISFPGGRLEETDDGPTDAALRETEEEIGLKSDQIEIIGQLSDYITRTGFRVTPIVGLIESPYQTITDDFEVAEVFEVPFSFLMDRSNHQKCSRVFMGKKRHFWAMPYERYFIWGATAGMLRAFSDFLES